ncbi:ABC transporter permease [Polymorphobacter glacialis]|uniref:ABC transporter permease n=1 Tax=Sandarakinorhabdus glacialis TaxID=1614636 RepID=A0A917EBW9_9SPHN|nr:ABC transporter permease [Polymorphobacter glacialis]
MPWLIAALATTALYFGKSVLIPIILAGLVSFLLAPVAGLFRRIGLPRGLAVLCAVLLALASFGAVTAVVVGQAATLGKDAPVYVQRVGDKVQDVRSELTRRFDFLLNESAAKRATTSRSRRNGLPPPTASGALPVEIQAPPLTATEELKTFVLPALAPLETTLIVLIVTIFILLQKEDLRDRMIRLMGTTDLHRTTVALDDGAKRLSRYFLSQFAINSAFGAIVWGGLYMLDVPAPGLWGILAGLLRFVPYVGSIIAAIGPLALAAAVDPGWDLVIYVALLFLILEPFTGYVVEPLLYGHSTGLSPVSVVVAALFWTWIWGPVGLVLSMPLTLTLVVLGHHIPAFAVFDILLGNRPALSPAETFYQRVLANHPDEAVDHANVLLQTTTLATYYDDVVLGALRMAAADVDRGAVERSALHAVCEATLEVLASLEDRETVSAYLPALDDTTNCTDIVCMPGRGPLDVVVSKMVVQLLRDAGHSVSEQSRDRLPGRDTSTLELGSTRILCLLGLFDQRATTRIQPITQRMQQQFPGIMVLLGVRRGDEDGASDIGEPAAFQSLAELCASVSEPAGTAPV